MDAVLPERVVVDGVEIAFGVSGTPGYDLVLLHGSGGFHQWWHAAAPALEADWRVIAIDLSGHGDSGEQAARADYRPDRWAREVIAVLEATRAQRVVFAAHSMGGRVAMVVAAERPDLVAGIVLVDTNLGTTEEDAENQIAYPGGERKFSPTREEVQARFRLSPPQPPPPDRLLEPIRKHSAKRMADGWSWKSSPNVVGRFSLVHIDELAPRISAPIALLYGTESEVVSERRRSRAVAILPTLVEIVPIEGARHHVMIDEPELTAESVDAFARRFVGRA
jgi:pimeloyl-ACP methyl ester carboxylesterase